MGDVPRLIVFDLDGTLIDSRRDLADAANALLVERGGTALPEEVIGGMVGDGAAMLVQRALTAAGVPPDDRVVSRFLELYDDRLLKTTRPYPGILDAVQALAAAATLAVLTNKPLAPSRRLLDALRLSSFFASTIGGDGPLPRKPDPAGLLHLISQHGSTPNRTVLVGDSRIDVATARAAGTAICVAQYGFGFEGIGEDMRDSAVVRDPRDLPDVLRQLLS